MGGAYSYWSSSYFSEYVMCCEGIDNGSTPKLVALRQTRGCGRDMREAGRLVRKARSAQSRERAQYRTEQTKSEAVGAKERMSIPRRGEIRTCL